MATLAGKSALVTGGSRGIGRAIVERLASDGAKVTFSYQRDANAAAELLEALQAAGGAGWAVRADQGRPDDVVRLYDEAEANCGPLDIVVNNAGAAVVAPIAETTDEDFDRVVDVNLRGTFVSLRQAARRLQDGGRIVNISTINTVMRGPGISLYAATKAAVEQLTVVAAHELGGRGITVNCVSPGATDTEMLRGANTAENIAGAVERTPLRRLGEGADIAAVVAFLVGPDGGWMTGQNLRAGGGLA